MSIKTPPAMAAAPPGLSDDVLRLIDKPGPRYTSYPTADRFSAQVASVDYELALNQRARAAGLGSPVGLCLHIPFCESVCCYCACNKVVTRQHGRALPYLQALGREMALHAQILGYRTPIATLHLGGGTPTFLTDEELTGLMRQVREHFSFTAGAERALGAGHSAVERGVSLTRDDLLRCSVIMALMCQGRVEFESIELAHLIDFRCYFQQELLALQLWQAQGLIRVEPAALELTPLGWFGVRAMARLFDQHLPHAPAAEARFSRIA